MSDSEDYESLMVTWTEDGMLLFTFYSEDGEIDDQYSLGEPMAYQLYLILQEKFKKLNKVVKVSLDPSDKSNK